MDKHHDFDAEILVYYGRGFEEGRLLDGLFGIEGPAWTIPDLGAWIEDPARREAGGYRASGGGRAGPSRRERTPSPR